MANRQLSRRSRHRLWQILDKTGSYQERHCSTRHLVPFAQVVGYLRCRHKPQKIVRWLALCRSLDLDHFSPWSYFTQSTAARLEQECDVQSRWRGLALFPEATPPFDPSPRNSQDRRAFIGLMQDAERTVDVPSAATHAKCNLKRRFAVDYSRV